MMDSYAYLHLSLTRNEGDTDSEVRVLGAVDWEKLSSRAFQGFLSTAIALSIIGILAQSVKATVQLGSVGSAVSSVQEALRARGYFSANITGYYGPITQDAILRFQRDAGLQQDGVAGPQTLAALGLTQVPSNPNPTRPVSNRELIGLGIGDRGPGVTDLQTRLRNLGYFSTTPTGYFGNITQDAVVQFQRVNGVAATGLVTEETLALLNQFGGVIGNLPSFPPITQPTTSLRFGDFGFQVGVLQQQLQRLGYYNGPISNLFDADTEFAVTRFQRDNRIQVTGQVGTTTQAHLNRSITVATLTRPIQQPATLPIRNPVTTLPGRPPVTTLPTITLNNTVLSLGDRSVAVGTLQERLRVLGYYTGSINNNYDLETRRAVINFQRDFAITQTGQVGPTTQTFLFRAVSFSQPSSLTPQNSLSLGLSGEDVRRVQQELRALNYYGGPITGFYDQATQTAVVRFQQANRITPTGVIGPTTRTSLFNARLVTASSPTPSTTSTTSAIPTLSSPIIGINSLNLSSDSIRKVQERLRIQGLYYGPISGVYDERTQQAISRAQDLYGVSADTILFGGL